jgi:hypothetical protein
MLENFYGMSMTDEMVMHKVLNVGISLNVKNKSPVLNLMERSMALEM